MELLLRGFRNMLVASAVIFIFYGSILGFIWLCVNFPYVGIPIFILLLCIGLGQQEY